MCKTISIVNNKGGVGKTTSTGLIVQLLAYLNKKVLAIDLDPQCNLSMMLNCYERESDEVVRGMLLSSTKNIADLFKNHYRTREEVCSTIKHTAIPNLDIIPASKRHDNTVDELRKNQTGNNNIILKKALDLIKEDYDYIIIDNAPAKDVLTVNSLFTSDLVYVPVRLEMFSYEGLKETISTILYIKEEHEINIEFGGAFITQAETNTNSFKETKMMYTEQLNEKFLKTSIRKDIRISDIEKNFHPVLSYCPDTNAVFDYAKLIIEMNILDKLSEKILKKSISFQAD